MRAGLIGLVILIVVGVVVALNSFFIVNPMQQALVLQFGQVRQAIRDPGLNLKIPLVQDVLFLDKRVLDLNIPAQEIIAADQKRLVVDAFMRYRIANPVRFYQTVNNVIEGSTRLSTFAQSSLRAVLADATFQDIVRDDRPELMLRISADVAARARDIGVEVVDVKIRRADLPEANSEAIFSRMQTEREQEAAQIRAQGREAAQRVQAAADRTATVLRAEAQREAEQVRGEGDGQKNAIFARAYSADPQFFAFYRAMQAYELSLAASDTRLVLSPDTDFFRFFNDPSGGGSTTTSGITPPELPAVDVAPTGQPVAPEAVPGSGGGATQNVPAEGSGEVDGTEADSSALEQEAAGEAALAAPVERGGDAVADAELNTASDAAVEEAAADDVALEDTGIASTVPGTVTIVRPDTPAE